MIIDKKSFERLLEDANKRLEVGKLLIGLISEETPYLYKTVLAIEKLYRGKNEVTMNIVGIGTWWVEGDMHRVPILKEAKTDQDFWFVFKDNDIKLMPFGGIHEFERVKS
jgi:hypothetical protein